MQALRGSQEVSNIQECNNVYWDSLEHNGWTFYVAATSKGLCCITLPNESFEVLTKFINRHFFNVTIEQNGEVLQSYIKEIRDYLNGHLENFSVKLDLHGTPFQVSVWNALLEIPYGQSTAYSDIAQSIGKPTAIRAVGTAIGANPIPLIIPCHRVLGKNGTLTGFRGGLEMKSSLLQLEGVLLI